jgi:hypothetical protein
MMVGQYVRMISAPYTIGTIQAARCDSGQVSFLLEQDVRFAEIFPAVWLSDSEVEECTRPSDEWVATANKLLRRNA